MAKAEKRTISFMDIGLMSYEDVGKGIWLIEKNVIDNGLKSIIGCPVLLGHDGEAVGVVCNAEYNPEDALYYADFLLEDDDMLRQIDTGEIGVSCTYDVLESEDSGEYNGIAYSLKPTKIKFLDLSLERNPRYTKSGELTGGEND